MIRDANIEDLNALVRIAITLKNAGRFSHYGLDIDTLAESLLYRMESPSGVCLVYDHETDGIIGAAVGFVEQWTFSKQLRGQDDLLAISPTHYGTGVGRELVTAFVGQCRALGAGPVFIGAMAGLDDARAVKAFESLGAVPHGTMMRF